MPRFMEASIIQVVSTTLTKYPQIVNCILRIHETKKYISDTYKISMFSCLSN